MISIGKLNKHQEPALKKKKKKKPAYAITPYYFTMLSFSVKLSKGGMRSLLFPITARELAVISK